MSIKQPIQIMQPIKALKETKEIKLHKNIQEIKRLKATKQIKYKEVKETKWVKEVKGMNPPTADLKDNIKETQIILMCLALKRKIDYYPIYVYVYLTTNISTILNE